MRSELITALDAAYEAFAGYARPQRLEASPLRDPASILLTLSSAPLRQLAGKQIGPYAGWALTTVGSIADYKHFLPRILEQATSAPEWLGTQPQVIASKLNRAEWQNWPSSEQMAVLAVFKAAWREAMQKHPENRSDASEWLSGLATLGEDIKSLLGEWGIQARGNALLQIAELAMELPQLASPDPLEQIFWATAAPELRAQVVSWLVSAQIRTALSGADGIAGDDLWRISRAEKVVTDWIGSNG